MGRGLLLYIVVERLAMLDTDILTVPALFFYINCSVGAVGHAKSYLI